MLLLVMGFLTQSYLVYSDASMTTALVGKELAGRGVWLRNNCQSCHQMYGFGGFLGPDLTNVASRLQRQQLADQLSLGTGYMPRFAMVDEDIDSLWAFLAAMNRSGIGQARNPNLSNAVAGSTVKASPAMLAVQQVIEDAESTESTDDAEMAGVAAGFEIFRTYTCSGCHVLFGKSAIGAPDLSLSGGRLAPAEIRRILTVGVAPKMPASGLSKTQIIQVQSFLTFLADRRAESLVRRQEHRDRSFWSSLPWWEFK